MYAANFDNPLVRAVAEARRPASAWAVALAAAVFAAAVLLAASRLAGAAATWVAAALRQLPGAWPDIAGEAAVDLPLYGALILAAVVATWIEGRRLWPRGRRPLAAAAAGVLIGAAGFGAAVAIAGMAGVVHRGAYPPLSGPGGGILAGCLMVAFQSIAEEVYFRGWVQPVLCARWGPWFGLAATSVMFAALHVVAGARAPLAVLNLVLGGLLFGLLALRTGGLWAPAAAHFAWNWTESGVLGLDPNPGVPITGSVFDLDLAGPALWSGGADTMNASLATTLILAGLVAAIMVSGPRPASRPLIA
ncbi:MAG TPA: type II CAAX endopeptidase family protein [Caulobacteraceae bacterium]|nr:type II CAAX endopeptidase family protein [Caulobacteraceae bacterium]